MKSGDILSIEGFDPMDLDITYVQTTIEKIPLDGVIDINNAENLATLFLRCADYCGDLLAQAARFSGERETEKRSQKSASIYRKIKEKVTPTVAKEAYADDDQYIEAANGATAAESLLKWLEEKHANLIRAHILCKNLLARHSETERANSWRGSESSDNFNTPASSNSHSPSFSRPSRPSRQPAPDMKTTKPGFVEF